MGAESIPGTRSVTRSVLCGDGADAVSEQQWGTSGDSAVLPKRSLCRRRVKLCCALCWEAELSQICNGLRKKVRFLSDCFGSLSTCIQRGV